jgi:DNA-directed RNA polymerase specialized sigma24 family protein
MLAPSIAPPAVDPAWAEALRHSDCVRKAARAFACRYRGLALDPDDLTQEGLIVAHHIAARHGASRPDAYYAQAARNRFIDLALRRQDSVRLVGLEKAVLIEVPPDRVDEADLADAKAALADLVPPAQYVLRRHGNPEAGRPSTYHEIGLALGLCRRVVCRIERAALADLRVALGATP